jgi:hypothetical protein
MTSPVLHVEKLEVPSEEALEEQAAQLASLRNRVAAAQAETGYADPALIAEFAEAQRCFLDAKIRLEQMRMDGLLYEEAAEECIPDAGEDARPVLFSHDEDIATMADLHGQLLEGSPEFWAIVILLLGAFACFQYSPFSYPW